jgi:formylglycine-generating enzyme required for sulfatase activity
MPTQGERSEPWEQQTKNQTNMKHILTLIILLATLAVAAQEYSPCYTNNMAKGNTAFSQGRYSEAKAYYETAKKCNGGNPTEAQKKINQCNAKLNPASKPTQPSASTLKTDQTFSVNGISFKMVYVQGGTFTMGCTSEQGDDCGYDEKPLHSVTLSDFLIGETEVTQALWETVMGTTVREQRDKANPSWPMRGEGASYPMYYVNWDEAVEFCNKLNEKLQSKLPPGFRFALPTEAQWEYAARGGNKSQHYKYAGSNTIDEVAWYSNTTNEGGTKPVKTKKANELGLFDMSGNVDEWCSDWDTWDYYRSSPQTNPKGPSSGTHRVIRGGVWNLDAHTCRVSYRSRTTPESRSNGGGFRLALVRE